MVTKKSPKKYGKKNKKFYCDICDYYTSNKKDFSKHVKTLKHRNKQNITKYTMIVQNIFLWKIVDQKKFIQNIDEQLQHNSKYLLYLPTKIPFFSKKLL